VQATLHLPLTIPAPGAFILPFVHRSGAWRAADAEVAPGQQGVRWQVVPVDVPPDIASCPGGHGVYADYPLGRSFQDLRIRPGQRLIPPNAADPDSEALHSSLHGFHFVNVAAQVRVSAIEITPVLAHKLIPGNGRPQHTEVESPILDDPVPETHRLRKMVARIKEDYWQVGGDLGDDVEQRQTLSLEGGTHRNIRPECFHCPGYDLVRASGVEFPIQTREIRNGAHGG